METNYPVTVFGLRIGDQRKKCYTATTFFLGVLMVTAAEYKMLGSVEKLWLESVSKRGPRTYKQVAAASHKTKTTQERMSYNLYVHVVPNIWPPSSP